MRLATWLSTIVALAKSTTGRRAVWRRRASNPASACGGGSSTADSTARHFESLELDLVLEFLLEVDLDYFGTGGRLELAGKFLGRWTAAAGKLDDG